jgi:hypothetical protein
MRFNTLYYEMPQDSFNAFRVHIVMTAHHYMSVHPEPAHPQFLRAMAAWLTHDRNYLAFDNLPSILAVADMNVLNRYNMLGVYWLANHHDTR